MPAKAIMVQGTMSSAGKSLVTAGLCRIFHQDGFRVSPFKSQNMALNSYITDDRLEMGRAQAMQAEAAGIRPTIEMNPVLLKPTGESGSQVIVGGEVLGTMTAAEYYSVKHTLVPRIMGAYNTLAAQNDIVVIEGAGSPAEINLKEGDFVNMGMAKLAHAPVILVGDIDRGGVFAALAGTLLLLEEEERDRVKGLIINKFRGDINILRPGLRMIEEITGKPVLGTIPFFAVDLDDEDSLSDRINQNQAGYGADIAVIRLPRISNFTDFSVLSRMRGSSVRYVSRVGELGEPDLIILPGTKNTMADLAWMRQNGLEAAILHKTEKGTPIFGLCGGYQMLGQSIADPFCTEQGGRMAGMGLLQSQTVFVTEKHRDKVSGRFGAVRGLFSGLSGLPVEGYEIHMGQTRRHASSETPLIKISRTAEQEGRAFDGIQSGNGLVLGSYVHGIFDDGEVAAAIVSALLAKKGMDAADVKAVNTAEYKQSQYDLLADEIRKAIDIPKLYDILNGQ